MSVNPKKRARPEDVNDTDNINQGSQEPHVVSPAATPEVQNGQMTSVGDTSHIAKKFRGAATSIMPGGVAPQISKTPQPTSENVELVPRSVMPERSMEAAGDESGSSSEAIKETSKQDLQDPLPAMREILTTPFNPADPFSLSSRININESVVASTSDSGEDG